VRDAPIENMIVVDGEREVCKVKALILTESVKYQV
jgi:hypothetical protein